MLKEPNLIIKNNELMLPKKRKTEEKIINFDKYSEKAKVGEDAKTFIETTVKTQLKAIRLLND